MIEEEQKELADYIKSVHLSLRCKSRQVGAELAWKQHVENEEVLRNYAVRMKNLAEKYWAVNNKQSGGKNLCRIDWMVNVLKEYFQGDELEKEVIKEKTKMKNFVSKLNIPETDLEKFTNLSVDDFREPYKVLDVGSCYDPFSGFDFLKTFPIDLYPAISDVKKCDFTQIQVGEFSTIYWFRDNLDVIPREYFDAVIFSLFLEYLPSSEQRYSCCEKAYKALRTNGLLLIATPDSKHESANAGIMKSWKIALAQIGFARIKIEKLKYMYCMAFRKAVLQHYPRLLYNIRDLVEARAILIPQDYVDYEKKDESHESFERSDENIKEAFVELPFS